MVTPTTTKFAYDANGNAWVDYTGTSTIVARHIFGMSTDSLIANITAGSTTWYLQDILGSTRDLTNAVGTLTDHLDYNSFGKLTHESSPGTADRYQWTSREVDVELGLQYNRARYYDASTQRWLSQDPLGFDAGDSNLYRYVNNAPTGATDPSGMDIYRNNEGKWQITPSIESLQKKVDQILNDLAKAKGVEVKNLDFVDAGKALSDRMGDDRFVWTKKGGFVDLRHFFAAAYQSNRLGGGLELQVFQAGFIVERDQAENGDKSGFAFEDIPSNRYGCNFAKKFKDLPNLSKNLANYINDELGGLGKIPDDKTIEALNEIKNFGDTPILDPNSPRLRVDKVTGFKYMPINMNPELGGFPQGVSQPEANQHILNSLRKGQGKPGGGFKKSSD